MDRSRSLATPRRRFLPGLALVAALAVLATASAQSATSLKVFTASLSPHDVVPPVTSPASGLAVAVLDGHQLDVTGAFSGLASPVPKASSGGAQLYQGAAGASGSAVDVLNVDGTITGTFHGSFELTASQLTALENGELYVQLHSEQHPAGVLRAQLTRYSVTG